MAHFRCALPLLLLLACTPETPPSAGGDPTPTGTGATAGGSGGTVGGTAGSSGGGEGGSSPPPVTDAALAPADGPLPDAAAPPAAGQGPVAEGQIVYSQDFENDQEGITPSPTNLPESRAMRVDDPLGQRGKVMRVQWLPGDDFRISQFRPRNNISNTGFSYNAGDRVSYAWGYLTTSTYIGATLAQNITGGDPIWMIQGRDNGEMDMVPGLVRLPVKLEANRWHDFRADVNYVAGAAGSIELYIDGVKVFTKQGGLPIGPRAHWDGGVYITGFGMPSNMARTVYFSNLSVGKL